MQIELAQNVAHVQAEASDTVRTTIFGPEWPAPHEFIGQTVVAGQPVPLPKFSSLPPTPDTTGDFEEMALIAGESAGLVKAIKPAGEIVQEMMEEARQLIEHQLMDALHPSSV